MSRLLPLALVAALLISACSDDDDKQAAQTQTTPATTTNKASRLPANCDTNAQGTVRVLDRKKDRGIISSEGLGDDVRFRPSRDIAIPPVKQGRKVFFTYRKTKDGVRAVCLIDF